jgi:hypothetical protein
MMPFHFFAAGTITLGYKQYELSNHLGNVLTTIADNVIKTPPSGAGLLARIVSTQDYYPFGMGMVERAYQEPTVNNERNYRFGFNNQEIDDDLENGAVVFKYRIESTKLCRFWSVDPLAASYPWNSSYAFAENRVIDGIDLEGKEWLPVNCVTAKDYGNFFIKAQDMWNAIVPLSVRAILNDLTFKTPITEKNLSPDQRTALQEIAPKVSSRGKNKNLISYKHYETNESNDPLSDVASVNYNKPSESSSSIYSKSYNAKYQLKTTLGQATLSKKNGELQITDRYDFNDALPEKTREVLGNLPSPIGGVSMRMYLFLGGAIKAGFNPYQQARNIGTWYGSSEKDKNGAEVNINIKK